MDLKKLNAATEKKLAKDDNFKQRLQQAARELKAECVAAAQRVGSKYDMKMLAPTMSIGQEECDVSVGLMVS